MSGSACTNAKDDTNYLKAIVPEMRKLGVQSFNGITLHVAASATCTACGAPRKKLYDGECGRRLCRPCARAEGMPC